MTVGVSGGLMLAAVLLALSACGDSAGERTVRAALNDPDSAQFREVRQSKRNNTIWCGQVNAKNRFGGMVGFTRFVADVERDTVAFASTEHRSSQGEPVPSPFPGRWDMFCE